MSAKEIVLSDQREFADEKSAPQMPQMTSHALIDEEVYRRHEKSLVRKLDLTLMPMIWFLYMFNYLDRNNIAYVTSLFRREPGIFVANLHLVRRSSTPLRRILDLSMISSTLLYPY